ncbi:MAG: TRAP transporter small permease subunit [Desulfobacterales bacterium]|nr:TRAP transporter small permease subunit [Desulfobacterales bacterium]
MDLEEKAHQLPVIFRLLLKPVIWFGHIGSWLIAPLIIIVVFSVLLSMFRVGIIAEWETRIPLFGTKLTLISLGELQWHLFGAMIFLTGGWTLLKNRHVKVDLFYARCSRKVQLWINLLGNAFLLLPFCSILLWYSTKLMLRAYSVGEGSLYDGLVDRFLVKSVLPLGFFMLIIVGLISSYNDIINLINEIRSSKVEKDLK